MQADNLPTEIWERISYFVHRPPPLLGTGCIRKDYHQQDLTVVLRLNTRFFNIAGKILYANPIVDDPFQFLHGLSHSPSCDCTAFKHESLRHVRTLDLTHKQGFKDSLREPYYDPNEQERGEWENDFFSQSTGDLEICSKSVHLLNQIGLVEYLKNIWNEGIDRLRIGGYDEGWWADKLSQIKYNQLNRLNDFSRIYVYESPDVLYNQVMDEDEEPEILGLSLLQILT
ncbi:hypothetical protein L486_07319 [Kwoniella mangroviensis CBS 10435]|uniref:Uncharacterized protein n=1 Tax=Kwoniella mangroviensis CBS 10435 TaxID=1331196 RepID=A0A1B9IHV8_9TREE|nr:hypothetical protein L486_07319 [Kwoniella mangroviensis CBS 10435]